MYIRCAQCKTPTWIRSLVPGEAGSSASCQSCGREYSLERAAELGGTAREQYRAAREFAESHQVDLPGAYSVLLGIMPLTDAREAKGRTAEAAPDPVIPKPAAVSLGRIDAPPAPRPAPRRGGGDNLPFDPAFRAAVSEGLLSVQQAIERGNRKAWATKVAARHGLTLDDAYRVADNRESLHSVLIRRPPKVEVIPPRAKARLSGSQRALVVFLALVLAGAIGFHSWQSWQHWVERSRVVAASAESAAPAAAAAVAAAGSEELPMNAPGEEADPALPTVDVQRNGSGRLVRIEGPDPRSVLIAYCGAAVTDGSYEALELAPGVPDISSRRLGIFRDYRDTKRLFAIAIHRDQRTRRWYAGDGRAPLERREAPAMIAGQERMAVDPS